MKLVYRILAFTIGALVIIGGVASIIVPAKNLSRIKSSAPPQLAIVQNIDKPLRRSMQPNTVSARITNKQGLQSTVEIETYNSYSIGSQITVLVDPENAGTAILNDSKMEWQSLLFTCLIIGVGILALVAAFAPKGAHDSVNQKLEPLARISLTKTVTTSTESKWANAALIVSLFNLTFVAAPIAAPVSIVLGLVAIRDIKIHHKTGQGLVVFVFVLSGLFAAGILTLALIG